MNHDPQGYYDRLELDWRASPAAIHAAYRRKARVLHPDIPRTGDAAAFMAVKEAYDVLADPLRRAAYDRAARSLEHLRASIDMAEEIRPAPPPPPPEATTHGSRLSDVPPWVWIGIALVVVVGAIEVGLRLITPQAPTVTTEVPATAPSVAPAASPPAPRPIRLVGVTNVYVLPAGGPALVLRYDPARQAFLPMAQLPPFSAVQALRVLRDNGLVEIRLTETMDGYVDATRLAPGNAVAARRAYCAYNAGPQPSNGEILTRSGAGAGETTIENHSGQPMVVKLRTRDGIAAATVYLEPGGDTTVTGLPGGAYRPDFAIGALWSRACNSFAAGMRAERFPTFVDLSRLGTMAVPPDDPNQPPPVDIADQTFEHD